MIISFKTVFDGRRHAILLDTADVSKFKPEALHAWDFDFNPEDTGTLILANSMVDRLGVSRDENGRYNHVSYDLAFNKGYVLEHAAKITQNGVDVPVSFDSVLKLSDEVCREAVAKARGFFDKTAVIAETKTDQD